MKYVLYLMFGLTVFGSAYIYLTDEVPGGEKRYQQLMRQMSERRSGN
jgi:hypothetical protein